MNKKINCPAEPQLKPHKPKPKPPAILRKQKLMKNTLKKRGNASEALTVVGREVQKAKN